MALKALADTRYSFGPQFLVGAAIFVRRSSEIERNCGADVSELLKAEHRACVVSAIMQSVAALETEIYEICYYGPGSHLGSNGTDIAARDYLRPRAEMIDRHGDVLSRYCFVLRLLNKRALPSGEKLSQHTALLVRLRNELVHYKSKWGQDMAAKKLWKGLRALKHPMPPFASEHSNFFPHQCLSAGCAAWAVTTAVAFMDAFYFRLGTASRLDAYRPRLTV